jgi:hypothetical protein
MNRKMIGEAISTHCMMGAICIRKQHTNHMEDDIKRILQDKQFHLQLKSEQKEIIQNVLERKDSMAVLPTALERACITFSPLFSYPQKVVLHSILARFCLRSYDFVISLPF